MGDGVMGNGDVHTDRLSVPLHLPTSLPSYQFLMPVVAMPR